MKTLKMKSSPTAVEYQERHGMTKREFDEKFDYDLASITKRVNKEIEERRCGTIPLDG